MNKVKYEYTKRAKRVVDIYVARTSLGVLIGFHSSVRTFFYYSDNLS